MEGVKLSNPSMYIARYDPKLPDVLRYLRNASTPLVSYIANFNHELVRVVTGSAVAASASALPMTTRIHLESRVLPNSIKLPWLRLQG